MTPEGLVSLPWYIWVLCTGVELLCRPEETPRQRNLGADREAVDVFWSAQDERGCAGHQQHLLQPKLCTSQTLCPVLGYSTPSLFLQGHEEKSKEPTAGRSVGQGLYHARSQDVHPSSPFSSTLCGGPPPQPAFLWVRWLVWWSNPVLYGLHWQVRVPGYDGFLLCNHCGLVGLIIAGSCKAVLVAWSLWCPMFRPSAIPWAQKHSGAAFCQWRALCFSCQGRAPNLKGRGLHCDSPVEARQRLYRCECLRVLWSSSLSARVACTTSGPAAAFSLASGPLYPFAWDVITKYHRLGGLNNRNLLSRSSGDNRCRSGCWQVWFLFRSLC